MAETTQMTGGVESLRERITALRTRLREQVGTEEGAWGVDGHTFAFEVALARPLPIGGYVVLSTRDGRRYLGQVVDQRIVSRPGPRVTVDLAEALGGDGPGGNAEVTVNMRLAVGEGALLATIDDPFGAIDRYATFDLAEITLAPAELVDEYVRWSVGGATGLTTGAVAFGGDEPVPLLTAKGFNRHTFLCGQSGSGKTYGLGVVLERLLLDTTISMVIMDPNSDYVGLGDLLPADRSPIGDDAYDAVRRRWDDLRRRLAVVGPAADATPFKVLFGRLTSAQQALVLGLDPIRDAEEFTAFRRLRDDIGDENLTVERLLAEADDDDDDVARGLAMRMRNIGISDWEIWAGANDTPVLDALPKDVRVLVADLGKTELLEERSVQSAAVLEWLWRGRHARQPRLIVIDEAHNVCPQFPTDPMQAMATDHVVRIAAEGRKYGLYLLLSTQQPQKIHANVLAQCDNLILMRMNSSADVEHLSRVFGFIPAPLLRQAAAFRLGEGLVAGKIASHPVRYRGARRWTREGGADVSSGWAG